MVRTFAFARAGILLALLALLNGSPALAFNNPLNRGPLADFLNLFREQAIPRQVVAWQRGFAPGTVSSRQTIAASIMSSVTAKRSSMASALAGKASPGPARRQ
jgi:hypothetical protein